MLPLLALIVSLSSWSSEGPVKRAPDGIHSGIRFEHLSGADGVSDEYVFQILQDCRGFIWFSTTNGLNRYDGYEVVRYSDVPTRMFHTVTVPGLLYQDRSGTLWIGAQVLAKFDPDSGALVQSKLPNPGHAPPTPETITAFHDDANGFLWLGTTASTLYRFDPRTGVFVKYSLGPDIATANSTGIHTITQDEAGTLWLGTPGALVRFNPARNEFKAYPHTHADATSRAEYAFNSVVGDKTGKLWVHVPGGLERFDPRTGVFDQFARANFWYMSADPNGVLWLYGGWPGLQLFDPKSGRITTIRHYAITPSGSERDDGLGALLPDLDGNVWVNFRRSGGLDRYSPALARFGKFVQNPDDPTSLSGGPVRGFSEDSNGNIWIATSGHGLNKLNPVSGVFTQFLHNPGDPESLDSDEVYSMYEDHSGTFWVGTYKGIGKFDRDTGKYVQLRGSLDRHEYASILEDRKHRFWVGDWLGGLHLLDRRTGGIARTEVSGGFAVHEDRSGNLWFGTHPEGLSKIDNTGKVERISLIRPPQGSSSETTAVYSFYEDAEGIFWLGTQSGLFRFDPNSYKSTRYTTRDGLPENAMMCAVPDDLGNVWLSTFQRGISRLNLRENRFYNYDWSDGLQGNLFTSGACYRARDGRLYFGGRAGFNSFYPRDVLARLPDPPVVITEFQVNDQADLRITIEPGD